MVDQLGGLLQRNHPLECLIILDHDVLHVPRLHGEDERRGSQQFAVDDRRAVRIIDVDAQLGDRLGHVGLEDAAVLEKPGGAEREARLAESIAGDHFGGGRATDVCGADEQDLRPTPSLTVPGLVV